MSLLGNAWRAGLVLLLFAGAAASQTWRVRLLAPLGSDFSRKGDMVCARVVEGAGAEGGILEGVVRQVKAAAGDSRSSQVRFEFEKLHLPARVVPMEASVVEAFNSRGQKGVDEGGVELKRGSHGITRVFSHGGSVSVLGADAPRVSFASGSQFVLEVKLKKTR